MVDGRRAAKIYTSKLIAARLLNRIWVPSALLRAMALCNEGGEKGANNTDLLQMGVSYSHSSRFLHHP